MAIIGALIRPMDISYTGLEADVAVTREISLTISGWLLVEICCCWLELQYIFRDHLMAHSVYHCHL